MISDRLRYQTSAYAAACIGFGRHSIITSLFLETGLGFSAVKMVVLQDSILRFIHEAVIRRA